MGNPLSSAIQEQSQILFDAIFVPVFIVDENLRVLGAKRLLKNLDKMGL